ncbi:efflux RND transporter periplasmic adaptor subunit [Nereida sp. MMG025]|uniref:efflux RND transporter periplasmic adaptor subunit n=1 Tax=Nereida sp. MMG025 TaxID=2909981 RepID=UPI001F32EDF3|nr:biotin/lipoyl-binding protein [Nereida sp. MMG025]MCF6444381.1 biotin/lipoyl-binding protein [Nereida sp. MMG025]
MRFLSRSLLGVVLLALTTGLLAFGAFQVRDAVQERANQEPFARPARERVFAVNVIAFEPQTLAPQMTVFGQIESRRTLELRPAVSGEVVALHPNFTEGGRVREGDVLIELDPADAQSTVSRAQADVTEAQAELRDANQALGLAEDDLAGAQAQADLRERALQRQRDLQRRGVGTEAAVETAELAAAAARQAVISRRQAVANAQARIDLAQTRLSRQSINLADAQRDLEETRIIAEFDGTLAEVSVVTGDRASQGEALGRLVDPDQLEVAFRLSTSQYARLLDDAGSLLDAPVTVTLEVLGFDLTSQGRILRESASVAEGQTGRLIFASLDTSRGLKPGDFVRVSIDEKPLENVVLLPSAAVNAAGEVLVLGEEERLEVAQTTVLRRQQDDVIVSAPQLRGREVVAARSPVLGAGIKVRALRPEGRDVEVSDMVELSDERRAKLIAFVEGNTRMPEEARARILSELQNEKVPARIITRIEQRMGS